MPVDNVPDEHIRAAMYQQALDFRDNAPLTAAQAAEIILDGVRADRWRILVGDDAAALDAAVRAAPEDAYEPEFIQRIQNAGFLGRRPRPREMCLDATLALPRIQVFAGRPLPPATSRGTR